MYIDVEMTVRALHPFCQVDVLEVHGVLEVAVLDNVVVEVETIAFLVLLEDRAEQPSMAVIIGKLRVLQLRIQLRRFFEKIEVMPESARCGGFRVLNSGPDEFIIGGIVRGSKNRFALPICGS